MAAGHVDLIIDQGEDWTVQIYWTDFYDDPQQLTHPLRMQIKSPLGQVVADLNSTLEVPENEFQPISYSTDTGWIQLHLADTETKTIPPGDYLYDLFVSVADGKVYPGKQQVRLIAGKVFVQKKVTDV